MSDRSSAQATIDVATASFAPTLGQAESIAQYDSKLRSAFRVTTDLTLPEQQFITGSLAIPNVLFPGGNLNRTGHSMIAAQREIIRIQSDRTFAPQNAGCTVLMFGSSSREIKMYANCPNVIIHIGGKDGKDTPRTYLNILSDLRKRQNSVHPVFQTSQVLNAAGLVKCLNLMREKVGDQEGLKARFVSDWIGVSCDVICFYDSAYTLHQWDYCRMFRDTGAKVAYGYGIYPWELIRGDIVPSKYYSYHEQIVDGELLSFVTWPGNDTGYAARKSAYQTILANVVLRDTVKGAGHLAVQINFVVDAMMSFTLYPTTAEVIVAPRNPPACRVAARWLNILKSHDSVLGHRTEFVYDLLEESALFSIIRYVQALPPQTLTSDTAISNIVAFIRKRCNGISMSSKSIEAPWEVRGVNFTALAMAVLLDHLITLERCETLMDQGNGLGARFSDSFMRMITGVPGLGRFVRWLNEKKYTDKILQFSQPDYLLWSSANENEQLYSISAPEAPPEPIEEGPPPPPTRMEEGPTESKEVAVPAAPGRGLNKSGACDFCNELDPLDTGTQVFACGHKKETFCTFSADADKLSAILRQLEASAVAAKEMDTLAAVIQACYIVYKKDCVPFKRLIKVEYVHGGPGQGKSVLVRTMYKPGDLVVVPFRALLDDYIGADKAKSKIRAATPHKMYEKKGARTLFIDEFPCMNMDLVLLYLAANPSVDRIILVGDSCQTQLRENAGEGPCILNHLYDENGLKTTLGSIRKHTLRKNYRLGYNLVGWLNERFGYDMIAHRTDRTKVTVVDPVWAKKHPDYFDAEGTADKPGTSIIFGPARVSVNRFLTGDETDGPTIRAQQGKTYNKVGIVLITQSEQDTWFNLEAFRIVGMSRATDEVVIITSPSDKMRDFCRDVAASPLSNIILTDWGWVTPLASKAIEPVAADPIVVEPRPTTDAYSHVLEVAPVMSGTQEAEEINAMYNEVITAQFKNMTSSIPQLYEECMKNGELRRAHPATTAMASGWGVSYGNKAGTALAAIAARYNNIQKRDYPLSEPAKILAHQIAANHITVCYDPRRLAMAPLLVSLLMEDDSIAARMTKLQQAMVERNMIARLDADLHAQMEEIDRLKARFSNKPGFKPGVGFKEPNVTKVAQGIVADPTAWNMCFMWVCRILATVRSWVLLSVEDGGNVVITAHERSDTEMETMHKVAFDSLFGTVAYEHGSMDTESCDAMHTGVTQEIERYNMRCLGFADWMVYLYFQFHNNMMVESMVGSFSPGTVNTSGKSGTKTVNETVCCALALWVLTIKSRFLLEFEGDDIHTVAVKGALSINDLRLAEINSHVCKYSLIGQIGAYGEFCGKIIVGNSMCPSLVRRVNRMVATKYRSYEEFARSQQGIRQYVQSMISEDRVDECISGSVMMLHEYFEVPTEQCGPLAQSFWEFAQSMAHIDEAQWASVQKDSDNTTYILPDLWDTPKEIDLIIPNVAEERRRKARDGKKPIISDDPEVVTFFDGRKARSDREAARKEAMDKETYDADVKEAVYRARPSWSTLKKYPHPKDKVPTPELETPVEYFDGRAARRRNASRM